jgi:hypothetical protein
LHSLRSTHLYGVYLGDRLGLYAPWSTGGVDGELARASGIYARYAREWLEQQAATGILGVEDDGAEPDKRRFFLPPGHPRRDRREPRSRAGRDQRRREWSLPDRSHAVELLS